jgi:hypothetical protein
MSVQFQIDETPEYLSVRVIGANAMEEIWERFEWVGKLCERANKNKLLFDFTGAPTKLYLAERYFLGEHSQDFMLYNVFKVAAVCKPEQLDPKRFGEVVARNRGVNVRVFTDEESALAWLLQ